MKRERDEDKEYGEKTVVVLNGSPASRLSTPTAATGSDSGVAGPCLVISDCNNKKGGDVSLST